MRGPAPRPPGLFAEVPFSPFLLAMIAAWAAAYGINPCVAVGHRLMAWACSLDDNHNEILVGTGEKLSALLVDHARLSAARC